jgi:hypothetical protein
MPRCVSISMCVSLVAGRWQVVAQPESQPQPQPAPSPTQSNTLPTPHTTCTPAIAGAGGAAVLVTRGFASTMAAHPVQQAACPLQVAARVSQQHGHRGPASRLMRLELARFQWAMVLGDARCSMLDARCCCSRSRRHVMASPSVASVPVAVADSHHTLGT